MVAKLRKKELSKRNGSTLFLISLFLIVFIRSLTWHESINLPHTFFYIVFIMAWGIPAFFLTIGSQKKFSFGSIYLVFLLFYFVFFGLYNIRDLDFKSTIEELIRSVLMVLFLLTSKFWVVRYKVLKQTIIVCYSAMVTLMLLLFLFHFSEISITKTLSSFWQSDEQLRYRNNFGFFANNIAAEYSLSVIVLSFYLIKIKKNWSILFLLIDLVMLFIIIANNSRGTLIAFLFVLLVYFVLNIKKVKNQRAIIKLLFFLVFLTLIFGIIYFAKNAFAFEDLLKQSNRFHFLDNIEAMKSGNKELFGLGRIDGTYFQEKNILYGTELNFMEMFYIGVYVKSGVVGSIYMAINLLIIIYFVISLLRRKSLVGNKKWFVVVLAYMLFISLFEEYLFSHSYITSTFFLLILLSYIDTGRACQKYYKRFERANKNFSLILRCNLGV